MFEKIPQVIVSPPITHSKLMAKVWLNITKYPQFSYKYNEDSLSLSVHQSELLDYCVSNTTRIKPSESNCKGIIYYLWNIAVQLEKGTGIHLLVKHPISRQGRTYTNVLSYIHGGVVLIKRATHLPMSLSLELLLHLSQ